MLSEEPKPPEQPEESPPSEEVPAIEDAYEPEAPEAEQVAEDDPELLGLSARSLEDDASSGLSEEPEVPGVGRPTAPPQENDDVSDAASLSDEPVGSPKTAPAPETLSWDDELSAHRVAVELKHIEAEVRDLLGERDARRKRKLSGSRRWRELEEDVLAWRFTGRFNEATLARLHRLIVRRDYLFRRLRYLAGTRPTWNT